MITGDNEIYEASADGLIKIGLRGHSDPEARRGHTVKEDQLQHH